MIFSHSDLKNLPIKDNEKKFGYWLLIRAKKLSLCP